MKKKAVLYIIGFIISALCLVISISGLVQTTTHTEHIRQLTSNTQNYCIATVDSSFILKLPKTRNGQKRIYNFIRVSYTVDNVKYNNIDAGITSLEVSNGENILIHYNPSNPSDCAVGVSEYGEYYTLLYSLIFAFGVVIVSIMVLPIIAAKIRTRQKDQYKKKYSPSIPTNEQNLYYTDYNSDNDKSV